jgi:hypothetical protein
VLARNGTGPNLCGHRGGTGKVSGLSTRTFKPAQTQIQDAIHAELSGSETATACGITCRANAPILMLCRHLIEAGHATDRPLEAWRGPIMCLRVRSIGEGADLEINGGGNGFRPARQPDAASLVPWPGKNDPPPSNDGGRG